VVISDTSSYANRLTDKVVKMKDVKSLKWISLLKSQENQSAFKTDTRLCSRTNGLEFTARKFAGSI